MELICPAGTLPALRTAVDAGADAVYCGFRDETNARNFPGLNFTREDLAAGVAYAHERGVKVLVAINTYPRAGDPGPWQRAVADAACLGADAVILADIGLLAFAATNHPNLRLHLSVQASASNAEAIRMLQDAFGVQRVVLPRVFTVSDIRKLNAELRIETEVFVFGGMCTMAEGRCLMSSYATGQSPNLDGACSPASHVTYERRKDQLASRLGAFTINVFGLGEMAGYPTLCKGRFMIDGQASYVFEEPTSLNAADLLDELEDAGVTALKIEGRQRGQAYIAQVVAQFRKLLDTPTLRRPRSAEGLRTVSEGGRDTTGAYERSWR